MALLGATVAKQASGCEIGGMDLGFADILVITHVVLIIAFGLRIVSRQPPSSVAFAWLMLVAAMPFGGAFAYLMIGERRISAVRSRKFRRSRLIRQAAWERALRGGWGDGSKQLEDDVSRGMSRLGWISAASPAVNGDVTELTEDFDKAIDGMIADIESAQVSVLIETYIWEQQGRIIEVADALKRAAQRGIVCRVLADGVGSGDWLRGHEPDALRAAGVHVTAALPVGVWHNVFGRADLRLHRKIMTVDNRCAWTGSMNMVDPRFFKQDAGVGEWMDAMVRVEGGIVAALVATVIADLAQESDVGLNDLIGRLNLESIPDTGALRVQAIPSGPGTMDDGLQLMLLSLLGAAEREVTITTPYFAPDDAVLKAMRAAAGRGVAVKLVVPHHIDSLLVRYASRSFFSGLMEAGVEIYEFGDGLLHTKSITADGKIAMFGSVNLDYRSLWLNYEIALFFYGDEFTARLGSVQQAYIRRSARLDEKLWERRSTYRRFLENLFRLLNPLL